MPKHLPKRASLKTYNVFVFGLPILFLMAIIMFWHGLIAILCSGGFFYGLKTQFVPVRNNALTRYEAFNAMHWFLFGTAMVVLFFHGWAISSVIIWKCGGEANKTPFVYGFLTIYAGQHYFRRAFATT